jgi:(2Fe-2S) ferredoxin
MTYRFTAYMFAFYDEHPHINPDGKPVETKAEGEVWYRIVDGERAHHFIQQFHNGDLIPSIGDIGNIWSWDGNRENPTVRPSFLIPDYHFHCFVTNGKIDVLPDSRVDNTAIRMTWDEFFGRKHAW